MEGVHHPIDRALLDDWQRDFPVTTRPFLTLAEHLGTSESDVITRLRTKIEHGQITRVGATCAPNTISASTLAAVAAPEDRIEEVARIIGAEQGVNHSYLREHDWNLRTGRMSMRPLNASARTAGCVYSICVSSGHSNWISGSVCGVENVAITSQPARTSRPCNPETGISCSP